MHAAPVPVKEVGALQFLPLEEEGVEEAGEAAVCVGVCVYVFKRGRGGCVYVCGVGVYMYTHIYTYPPPHPISPFHTTHLLKAVTGDAATVPANCAANNAPSSPPSPSPLFPFRFCLRTSRRSLFTSSPAAASPE